MLKIAEFAQRRKRLAKTMGARSIAILASAPIAHRNGDFEYPYRQNSDFYYLTGFEEPEAVALIIPQKKGVKFILFNQMRNREQEIWTGIRAGQEGACQQYGADEAYPIEALSEKLPSFLENCENIHHALGMDKQLDALLLKMINKIRGKIRAGLQSPLAFIDITATLHEMRLIKSPAEIALMRKAAEISGKAHIRAMQFCRPGMYEYQLEAEFLHECQRVGARFAAYNPIVGSGPNSCILHYNTNNRLIQPNDIILIDAGCEYQNYASDITRTFPANGKFSSEQRAIYEIVWAAHQAAIQKIRPGSLWSGAQDIIVEIMTQGLKDLGLLKGSVASLIEQQAYLPFYMHKSGHWLGLDVHDVGRYKINGKWRKLEPGMVLTVEPGIYISADIPGVPSRWHHIGVRIEDDILVTEKVPEILSKNLPSSLQAIEELMVH